MEKTQKPDLERDIKALVVSKITGLEYCINDLGEHDLKKRLKQRRTSYTNLKKRHDSHYMLCILTS